MKNSILVFVIGFLSFSTFSQSKTSFGFRSGVNIANLSNTNLETKTGLYLGALVNIKISELYTLQPELGYSNQGADAKNTMDENVVIHYISVSVANKFFVKDSPFHFIIAPGFDFDSDDSLIGLANRNEGNDVTFIDLNIGLGIGIDFKNGLGIEARYKRGLVDVFSGDWHSFDSQQYEDENQFNTVFQLGMYYKFKF
ncbi:porin family protein [Mariniflexile gromovii]|uniref:PorT family protein n=1 Tax=Mariniflexile gromovii TaxID=362523 RepID=A0ABS4BYZ8_9FLAO|nr:porin family protein [Mariniflexile gromovii]MBP0905262.1 PorT family protein [Mariniflexile gromovii]